MNNIFKYIKLKLVAFGLISTLTTLNAETSETLVFIGDDLQTGISYTNMRYDSFGQKSMLLGENYNKNKLSYIKPDGYKWIKMKHDGENQDTLTFQNTNNYAFLQRKNLKESILYVTGRLSNEMVVKCVMHKIPIVVSKAAVTFEGIKAANEHGVTLIGFAREHRMNVYTHSGRVKID